MYNPSQQSSAGETAEQPLTVPSANSLRCSAAKLKFYRFVSGLTQLAQGRLLTGFRWMQLHRRESAALILVAMMASSFVAQNSRHRSILPAADDREFIGIEQLLSEFDGTTTAVLSRSIDSSSVDSFTSDSDSDGSQQNPASTDSDNSPHAASSVTMFAVRSATTADNQASTNDVNADSLPTPVIRINRTNANDISSNANAADPEIRPLSAKSSRTNNNSRTTEASSAASAGIRFRGGIEPLKH